MLGNPQPVPRTTRQFYAGRERLFNAQRQARTPIPPGWRITVDGAPVAAGIDLGARERREVDLAFQIPAEATPGVEISFNIAATDPVRGSFNGITVQLRIR
jgi:hypothetical protein